MSDKKMPLTGGNFHGSVELYCSFVFMHPCPYYSSHNCILVLFEECTYNNCACGIRQDLSTNFAYNI